MKTLPVEVTAEGVLIPIEYLQPADEFEAEIQNGYVVVRPKSVPTTSEEEPELLPSESSRFSFIGIARSKNPNASYEVEEILEKELGLRVDQAAKK
jgi:hypothetical protein